MHDLLAIHAEALEGDVEDRRIGLAHPALVREHRGREAIEHALALQDGAENLARGAQRVRDEPHRDVALAKRLEHSTRALVERGRRQEGGARVRSGQRDDRLGAHASGQRGIHGLEKERDVPLHGDVAPSAPDAREMTTRLAVGAREVGCGHAEAEAQQRGLESGQSLAAITLVG